MKKHVHFLIISTLILLLISSCKNLTLVKYLEQKNYKGFILLAANGKDTQVIYRKINDSIVDINSFDGYKCEKQSHYIINVERNDTLFDSCKYWTIRREFKKDTLFYQKEHRYDFYDKKEVKFEKYSICNNKLIAGFVTTFNRDTITYSMEEKNTTTGKQIHRVYSSNCWYYTSKKNKIRKVDVVENYNNQRLLSYKNYNMTLYNGYEVSLYDESNVYTSIGLMVKSEIFQNSNYGCRKITNMYKYDSFELIEHKLSVKKTPEEYLLRCSKFDFSDGNDLDYYDTDISKEYTDISYIDNSYGVDIKRIKLRVPMMNTGGLFRRNYFYYIREKNGKTKPIKGNIEDSAFVFRKVQSDTHLVIQRVDFKNSFYLYYVIPKSNNGVKVKGKIYSTYNPDFNVWSTNESDIAKKIIDELEIVGECDYEKTESGLVLMNTNLYPGTFLLGSYRQYEQSKLTETDSFYSIKVEYQAYQKDKVVNSGFQFTNERKLYKDSLVNHRTFNYALFNHTGRLNYGEYYSKKSNLINVEFDSAGIGEYMRFSKFDNNILELRERDISATDNYIYNNSRLIYCFSNLPLSHEKYEYELKNGEVRKKKLYLNNLRTEVCFYHKGILISKYYEINGVKYDAFKFIKRNFNYDYFNIRKLDNYSGTETVKFKTEKHKIIYVK